MQRMKPVWNLVIGVAFLIIPTAIYLGFLIPKMQEEYIILMSSGGVIGGAGMFGTSIIPEKMKYGTVYKLTSKSFTLLVIITLVREFVGQIIGLAAVFAVSYIIFIIFKERWKHARREKENGELAEEVARAVTEATE